MIPAVAVLVLLAQQTSPGASPTAKQKQIDALVTQVRRLAGSEPVVFGIDTRLRLVNALPVSYSKLASDILRDDEAELAGVTKPDEQSGMRVQIAVAWARFDLEQAERVIVPLRRGAEHDYIAEGHDQLYRVFEQEPFQARSLVSDGLKAGAFRMIGASRLFETYAGNSRAAATALFSDILAAFPSNPFPADIGYLLDQTKQIVRINRDLALEATDLALRAADSDEMQDEPKAKRQELLRSIAAQLKSIDPARLKRYLSEHQDLDQSPAEAEAKPQPGQDDQKALDISSLSFSDALTQARAIESLTDRIAKLIELSRREDLTADQRTSLASEALHLIGEMPISGDRLVGTAMIARDFARRSEFAMAGLAAQMLAETFAKACDCGDAKCKRNGEDIDCLGSVQDFAEYLNEFKVSPESMGLSNISLDARLLIMKLAALLTSR